MTYENLTFLLNVITLAVVFALAYAMRRIIILERMILRVESSLLRLEKKIAVGVHKEIKRKKVFV